jgi:putative SOS response-associated peptidase YedK
MCTLYSQVKAQAEIRALINAIYDTAGNLQPQPAIFPDYVAPVVRETGKGRELTKMRWGFPSPEYAKASGPVVNARETDKRFWRDWLTPVEHRCLVPATSFSEWTDKPDPETDRKVVTWFALSKDRPLFFFAGVWREWTGTRGTKKEPVEGDHLLYSFLTTDANKTVKPIHKKAMPVILTTPAEWETWLHAPAEEALKLQKRVLPEKVLQMVAQGKREDAV